MWIWKNGQGNKNTYIPLSSWLNFHFFLFYFFENSLWIWPEGLISSPSSAADSFPSSFHFHDTSSEKPALTSSPILYITFIFFKVCNTLGNNHIYFLVYFWSFFSLKHKMQVNGRAPACLSSCLNLYSPAHKTPFISRWWVNEKNSYYIYESIWLYSDFFMLIFHCASLSQKCWKCLPSLMRGVSKFKQGRKILGVIWKWY